LFLSQDIKDPVTMAYLVWANTYISRYVMHNSLGIIVRNTKALHTSLGVFASQLASIHWHSVGTILLQESTERMCLSACLLHSTAISLDSEYHHNPSGRHTVSVLATLATSIPKLIALSFLTLTMPVSNQTIDYLQSLQKCLLMKFRFHNFRFQEKHF